METNEVSLHQIKVFNAIKANRGWMTVKDVAAETEGVSRRTVAAHLQKLRVLGIVDVAEVFPSHRYRLSEFAEKRNKSYMQRIDEAAAIFGINHVAEHPASDTPAQ